MDIVGLPSVKELTFYGCFIVYNSYWGPALGQGHLAARKAPCASVVVDHWEEFKAYLIFSKKGDGSRQHICSSD